jgi:hypothetical protein
MFIGRPLILTEAAQDLPPEDAVRMGILCDLFYLAKKFIG